MNVCDYIIMHLYLRNESSKMIANFFTGAIARIIPIGILMPIQVIKTRYEWATTKPYTSVRQVIVLLLSMLN